jgi:NAD(P)-dependent dehydrogenase (short-subunit alcohol dehydrogenase family)
LRKVLLLGAGKIGRAIASLLGHSGDYSVRVGDLDEAALGQLRGLPNIELAKVDVHDPRALKNAMADIDDVVSACPFGVNPMIARAAKGRSSSLSAASLPVSSRSPVIIWRIGSTGSMRFGSGLVRSLSSRRELSSIT